MRITQDIRDYAASDGYSAEEALDQGMKEKAEEFRVTGSELYK